MHPCLRRLQLSLSRDPSPMHVVVSGIPPQHCDGSEPSGRRIVRAEWLLG